MGGSGRSRRGSDAEPTVLLVGADKSFHGAIAAALGHHGVYVETAPAHGVIDAVVAVAPDLVLLVGDAASDGGSSVLANLYASPHSSVVPVAILADDGALDERLRAFRHGAVAVIPRSASVDAIADRVAKLARDVPDRDGTVGYIGEATLDELVAALSKELRSGILSVRGPKGAEGEAIRVVLGGGRPLAQTIDDFVSRMRKHVVHAEPLSYEFDERAGGTVQLLGADALDLGSATGDVSGLRVLIADEDAARADAVAQALRAFQMSVVVTDFDPPDQRFMRLRQLDPTILLIDEAGLRGSGYELVRRMRRDTRLRWTSLLVVRWDEIWSDAEGAPQIARTLGTIATLAEPERALRERVEAGATFDTRLEITGPARLIRALATSARAVRATVHNPRLHARLEVSDQLVVGARAQAEGGEQLDGAVALSALLVLGSGRVRIERMSEPETVNIMSPIDVALSLADSEASPIQPSLPAPESRRSVAPTDTSPPPGLPGVRSGRALGIWAIVAIVSIVLGVGIAFLVVAGDKKPVAVRRVAPPTARAVPLVASAARAAALPSQVAPSVPSPPPAAMPAPVASVAADSPSAEAAAVPDTAGELAVKTPSCEELVGPSWSLLGSDQPGRALTENRLGRRALMLGKLDEAEVAFCRAATLDPTKADSFQALVRVLLLKRDTVQARQWAERVAKAHPEDVDVQGLYGDTLARAGDADRARTIWIEGARIDPTDTAEIRLLALTYARGAARSVKGADQAQADRLYRRAVLLDPLNATAAAGLARVLLVQNQLDGALHWAKRAVTLEPHDAALHVMLGDVLEKRGDLAVAREEWKVAYEMDPHDFRAASRMLRAPK